MKENLDNWIREARQDVPDSGEYRRLNRALLKEHMAVVAPRRRLDNRMLAGFVVLVLVVLFSGQLNHPGGGDFTDADLDQINLSAAARAGELLEVWGTSYGGRTSWVKIVRQDINGKIGHRSESLHDRPENNPRDFIEFLVDHNRDLQELTRTRPAQRETVMTFDGTTCNVRVWTFPFPGYGDVTRYVGLPVGEG